MHLKDNLDYITTNEYSSLYSNKYVYVPVAEDSDGLR